MRTKGAVFLFVLICATFTHGRKLVVLLAGQSNMAGRGVVRIPDDTITTNNIISLNKDSVWVRAKHPLHWDKPEAAVGMGIRFAKELLVLLQTNDTIALVPCAAGGTSIDNWKNNSYFAYTGNFYVYSNLINRAKKAAKSGTIIGMIWHQGETDATVALSPSYQNKLKNLFDSIRTNLNLPNMPIVAVELGRYLNKSAYPRWDSINVAMTNLKNVLQHYAVASSSGLVSNPDTIHFTSASQDSLGIRYARLFYPLMDPVITATNPLKSGRQNRIRTKVVPGAIRFQQDLHGPVKIDLYDLSGSLVSTLMASGSESQMSTGHLKGLFLLQMKWDTKQTLRKVIAIP